MDVAEAGECAGDFEFDAGVGFGGVGLEEGDGGFIAHEAEGEGGVGAGRGVGRVEGGDEGVHVAIVAEAVEGVDGGDADGVVFVGGGDVLEDGEESCGFSFAGGHGGGEADDPCGVVESFFDDFFGAWVGGGLQGFDAVGVGDGVGGSGFELEEEDGAFEGWGVADGSGGLRGGGAQVERNVQRIAIGGMEVGRIVWGPYWEVLGIMGEVGGNWNWVMR